MSVKLLNRKLILTIENIHHLVLTSIIFTAVHQSILLRKGEKLVALLVYSSFIRVLTSGFRIFPFSLVLVVVCA